MRLPISTALIRAKRVDECRRKDSIQHSLDASGRTTETIHSYKDHFVISPEFLCSQVGSDSHGIIVSVNSVDLGLYP